MYENQLTAELKCLCQKFRNLGYLLFLCDGNTSMCFSPAVATCQQNFVNSSLYGSYPQYQDWRMPYQFSYTPYHSFAPEYQALTPFSLHFITGNISIWFGCRNTLKNHQNSPNDLCIKHRDWCEYIAPNTGSPQAKYGNVYYHCKVESGTYHDIYCIMIKMPPIS